ncbi:hypothetical protein BM525_00180 [Alteromonas mediterranea]|nr:hypothetical protein BM525_00180 [Alteromonas mediterranea]
MDKRFYNIDRLTLLPGSLLRRTRLTAGFLLYIEAATFLCIRLTEFSKVDSNQLYAVNATANQFFVYHPW